MQKYSQKIIVEFPSSRPGHLVFLQFSFDFFFVVLKTFFVYSYVCLYFFFIPFLFLYIY